MTSVQFDLTIGGLPIRQMAELAQDAAAAGFSGLFVAETDRTAYLGCAAATMAADLDLLIGVAVAFPRSPMVTTQVSWELAEATHGRSRLGLGTWDEVANRLVDHYTGIATRVVSYFAVLAWRQEPRSLGGWGELARAVPGSAAT